MRALASDPREPSLVYLGTAEGVLFRSADAGHTWTRLEPGFPLPGMSLDNISVDPGGRVIIGYWQVAGSGGGVAISDDGGQHFQVLVGIAGQSVRALSIAPSDSDTWVVGTLEGVFRTQDAGARWTQISPRGHADLRNVESVAIDPVAAGVIYAGTWHLPWKTSDGGGTWQAVNRGMIDDSDVFTITLDVRGSERVYATACSGMYTSQNAAQSWAKIQGIPSSSRRTLSFAQDRARPDALYAGTTEGVWATQGGHWRRVTRQELIVNSVLVLPGQTVLAGTEGDGVLRSDDLGATWSRSNAGFSAHFVTRLLFHPAGRLMAGLQGGRYHGGVLTSEGPGRGWHKWGTGLEGRTILALAPADDGALAGTEAGLFASEAVGQAWRPLHILIDGIERRPAVDAVASAGGAYLAATRQGLLRSADRGTHWERLSLGSSRRVTALAITEGGGALAATALGLFQSQDAGASWRGVVGAPAGITSLHVPADSARVVFAVTEHGLFKSEDSGSRFSILMNGLPLTDLTGFAVSADGRAAWVSDFRRARLFQSTDGGENWLDVSTTGLMPSRVWDVAVDPAAPDRVLVATAGGGLHARVRAPRGADRAGSGGVTPWVFTPQIEEEP